jgi:hypothetical protein
MQWHLIIEEFRPTMEYIKGPKNIVANTLSHLKMTSNVESRDMADCYGLNSNDLPDDAFPVLYTLLHHEQNKNKTLLKVACSLTLSPKKAHTLLTKSTNMVLFWHFHLSPISDFYQLLVLPGLVQHLLRGP